MSKPMLIEYKSISPEEVWKVSREGYRVYMLPYRGNRVYVLSSDGATITAALVQDTMLGETNIVQGTTQQVISTGITLLLRMNNDRQSMKTHPTITTICATRGSYWYSRMQSLQEIDMYQARNQAITK